MKRLIGLTGSIASGKSLVSSMLRDEGLFVIDADVLSREICVPGALGAQQIKKEFGEAVFDGNVLNRATLAAEIFVDDCKRKRLNEILHPLINTRAQQMAQEYAAHKPNAIIVYDAALLIESGAYNKVDEVWLVVCDDDVRLQRLMHRDGLSLERAHARMDSQMSQEEKRKFADVIIYNSEGVEQTRAQVKAILKSRRKDNDEQI